MKLSMWMIANRLMPLMADDLTLQIRDTAKAVLNSARLAYATNCVYVYEEDNSVIFNGEGDIIRVKGLRAIEAFELLQGVFDYYQDWESQVEDDAEHGRFQNIVDRSERIFQNPLLIQNANSRALAMSHVDDLSQMDAEWQYIARTGYSSLQSIHLIRYDNAAMESRLQNGSHTFQWRKNEQMTLNGLTEGLAFDSATCGRITLLEKNRPVNPGDAQLLHRLGQILQAYMGKTIKNENDSANVFFRLIQKKAVNPNDLKTQLHFYNWKDDDVFQVVLLKPQQFGDSYTDQKALSIIQHSIQQTFPECVCLRISEYVALVAVESTFMRTEFMSFLKSFSVRNLVVIGFSLPEPGLQELSYMFRQAEFALNQRRMPRNNIPQVTGAECCSSSDRPVSKNTISVPIDDFPVSGNFFPLSGDNLIRNFHSYGNRFLLGSDPADEKLHFCDPVIRYLWKQKSNGKPELFDTLKSFLNHNQSTQKTADAMFLHRNTVNKRIRTIRNLMHCDSFGPDLSLYLQQSILLLEMSGQTAISTDINTDIKYKSDE